MKKSTILLWALCALLWLPSCKGSTPNDRAMYNLQGNVKSVAETDRSTGRTTRIAFTENGEIDRSCSDTQLASYEIVREYGKIEAVYEEAGSADSYTFDFDGKGRLSKIVHRDGFSVPAATQTVTMEYSGGDRLPCRQKIVAETDGGESRTTEEELAYRTDEAGNWTTCTCNGRSLSREIEYYDTAAAADNCPMTKSIDWDAVLQVLLGLLVLAASLAIIAHMVYENFFRKLLPTDYSAAGFEALRRESGRAPQASEAENARAMECLDALYESWSPIPSDNGEELRSPLSRKVVRESHLLVAQAAAECPTDEAAISRLNECCEALNTVEKRSFTGSKMFLGVSIVIAVLLSLISGAYNFLWMIGFSCAIYYLASLTPLFMQVRKEVNGSAGGPKFMSAIIGGLFGAVATAKTYKTVTEYSDGTKTTDVDNSETWFALIFGIVIMVVLAMFMWFVALISYLRNYVLYR